jgi:hypothetical protein
MVDSVAIDRNPQRITGLLKLCMKVPEKTLLFTAPLRLVPPRVYTERKQD